MNKEEQYVVWATLIFVFVLWPIAFVSCKNLGFTNAEWIVAGLPAIALLIIVVGVILIAVTRDD